MNTKLTWTTILLLLLINSLQASPNLDSLKQALQVSNDDTIRIHILIDLASAYKRDSIEQAKYYAKQAFQLAEKSEAQHYLVDAYLCLGKMYDYQGDNAEAEKVHIKALKLAEKLADQERIFKSNFALATTYWTLFKMDQALDYFHNALKYAELLQNSTHILNCYHYIGWVYHQLLIFDKTLEYYDKGIVLAQSIQDTVELLTIQYDKSWVFYQQEDYDKATDAFLQIRKVAKEANIISEDIRAIYMLGEVYEAKELSDSAMYYYRLCVDLSTQEGNWFELGESYQGIGRIYAEQNSDSSLYYLQKALQIAEEKGSPHGLAYLQLSLGNYWQEQKQYAKSLSFYEQAHTFFKDAGDDKRLSDILIEMSKVYHAQGKSTLAYETFKTAKTLADSLQSERNNELRQETEIRYQIRKKEEQISLLNETNALKQNQITQQRLLLISIAAILVLMIGLALASYRAFRQKQKANQLLADQNEEIRQQHAATAKAKKYIEEHAERLRALDKLKTRFFANVSHELRTPLTLILGPLQRLLIHQQFDNPIKKDLAVMQRNGKKLLELVEEILDISKLEANKLELNLEPSHLSSFVRRVFTNFESQASYLGIKYHLIEQIPEGYHALIDKNRVEKILNNLLANAMKFTAKNGAIMMTAQLVGQQFTIEIKDTGEGISAEDLPHVFDRYFQTKKTNAKAVGGTGIGLALSKELAELMGGRLKATSTLGKGSAFILTIPVKSAEIAEAELERLPEPEVNTEEWLAENNSSSLLNQDHCLLIVEDNPDMQQYIASLLEEKYKYILAKDGREALELLAVHGNKINLIISDVMMPRMDGLEFLKAVKQTDSYKGLPFIMLTALAAQEDKLKALTIGVDDYLIKPFFQTELLARVQNLLANYESRKSWKEEVAIETDEFKDAEIPVHEHELDQDEGLSDLDQTWIAEVEQEIRESIHKVDFSINMLAEHMNISTRQFQRKLKKVTGLTPVKYQQEVRLQIAREQLEGGDPSSVKEVAYRVGFQKVSYFSKLYLNRFGKRPSDYLK